MSLEPEKIWQVAAPAAVLDARAGCSITGSAGRVLGWLRSGAALAASGDYRAPWALRE